jgi:hypothetical protein
VALAELRFHHLEKHFIEPNNYDEILLYKILYFVQGYRTTSRIKKMGMHNKSENGHGARVALRAHPTYTDTQVLIMAVTCYNSVQFPFCNTLKAIWIPINWLIAKRMVVQW